MKNHRQISIHAAHEGGDKTAVTPIVAAFISIHAAHEGGDALIQLRHAGSTISIHAAHEGGDSTLIKQIEIIKLFQSTPPMKAATR